MSGSYFPKKRCKIRWASSGYGLWSETKPDWPWKITALEGFEPAIENDGRVSNGRYYWEVYITLRTIDDLIKLTHKVQNKIIIGTDGDLQVYNDYIE